MLCEAVSIGCKNLDYELILVDDGSRDESWTKIEQLKSTYKNLYGIQLHKNSGQHKALLCGIEAAQGEWIATLDDDLQFAPADITILLEKATTNSSHLVYGIPDKKQHSFWRNLGSRFVAFIFSRYADMRVSGSSFKLIHSSLTEKLILHNHPFLFIDEVLQWHAINIERVKVSHVERAHGKSSYTFWKLIRLGLKYLISYTTFPLRFISMIGLLAFLICLVLIIFFLYQKYSVGAELGFTALIVSIFMSTGLILFSLGVIGEYLNRLFLLQSGKPTFVVKKRI